LVGTSVTAEGILKLKKLHHLQTIYLYQTKVGKKDWQLLTKNFPGVAMDSGGYTIPFIATDTVIVKPPKITP
jgi:hypothetical protein